MIPTLSYLELPVVKHCNLNCRYCSHFANIEDKYYMPIESFENDMNRLSELFSNVTEMRLLGGEPLLHSQIGEFVRIAKKYFPGTELKIATNGLLIPTIKAEVLKTIACFEADFDISLYPPTQKIEQAIRQRLYDFGIRFYISEPIDKFQRRLLAEPLSAAENAWSKCKTNHCFVLCEGKMSFCYAPQLAQMAEKKFGYHFDIGDAIADIYNKKWTVESLLKFIQRPHACCAYCGEPETLDWTITAEKPDLRDWFVKSPIK